MAQGLDGTADVVRSPSLVAVVGGRLTRRRVGISRRMRMRLHEFMSAEMVQRQNFSPSGSALAEPNGETHLNEAAIALARSKSITLNDWLNATEGRERVVVGGRPSDMV